MNQFPVSSLVQEAASRFISTSSDVDLFNRCVIYSGMSLITIYFLCGWEDEDCASVIIRVARALGVVLEIKEKFKCLQSEPLVKK